MTLKSIIQNYTTTSLISRQARLDASGLLQHVMARGIERRDIFKDGKDRSSFLERLAVILEETQAQCYAWALIPNPARLA